MTYQIKAYGMLVHADTLKFQNSSKSLGKKLKKNVFCIYIILQKAMRPIGRSPASVKKIVKKIQHISCAQIFLSEFFNAHGSKEQDAFLQILNSGQQ